MVGTLMYRPFFFVCPACILSNGGKSLRTLITELCNKANGDYCNVET